MELRAGQRVRGGTRGGAGGRAGAVASATNELICVRDLHFCYDGGRAILNGVSLTVQQGTCVCLMGVNGCGKSTLIDCILGEHALQSGSVEIAGRPAHELSARERARLVAYVPQFHETSFPYDVRHVVLMGRTPYLGMGGVAGSDDFARVDAALEQCGIAHLAARPVTGLSGGEMQMVLLARALVQDAPLLMMDEPTAHLDFRNALLFMEAVERLCLHEGVTVLMATHAPNQAFLLEAAGVSVEVALMDGGAIVACGSPASVLSEDVLREVFGVHAQVWQRADMRQIVPLATVRAGADERAVLGAGDEAEATDAGMIDACSNRGEVADQHEQLNGKVRNA